MSETIQPTKLSSFLPTHKNDNIYVVILVRASLLEQVKAKHQIEVSLCELQRSRRVILLPIITATYASNSLHL